MRQRNIPPGCLAPIRFSKHPEWAMDRRRVGPQTGGTMSDNPLFSERLNRRAFLGASALGAASVALSACTTTDVAPPPVAAPPPPSDSALGAAESMYAARVDEGYQL